MSSFTFADLFAGIGGTRLGFQRQGGDCVFTCEKASEAQEAYERIWDDPVDVGDIKNVDVDTVPEHDVLLACWPCPSFSRIGDREGLRDERGSLFYRILRVIEGTEPTAFFLENVKDIQHMQDGKILDAIIDALRELGYTVQWEVLNALDFGLPQHRQRLIIVGTQTGEDIKMPTASSNALSTELEQRAALEELLVDDIEERFIASEPIRQDRQESLADRETIPEPSVWNENRAGIITPNPFASALRAKASWNYQLVDGYRRFTPRELLRLQGFPDWVTLDDSSESRVRRLTGNTIPVPMVRAVASELLAGVSTLPEPETRILGSGPASAD